MLFGLYVRCNHSSTKISGLMGLHDIIGLILVHYGLQHKSTDVDVYDNVQYNKLCFESNPSQ